MDLVTLVTACALSVDPKLMHALVWHQSGGEPWAVSVQGEANPRVYPDMREAIREVRSNFIRSTVRIGLAGVSVPPSKVTASVLLPCRNVAMAAVQITKLTTQCKTHLQLKSDATFCAVAVYRGSWAQPDVKFATDVAASVAKGDAPNFDMPSGTSTEIFDTAEELPFDAGPPVVDVTAAFADQARNWSSALFPQKSKAPADKSDDNGPHRHQRESRQPRSNQRKRKRKIVVCLCAARSMSLHDDAGRRPSSECENLRKHECGPGGTRQHDRRRAR